VGGPPREERKRAGWGQAMNPVAPSNDVNPRDPSPLLNAGAAQMGQAANRRPPQNPTS